MRSEQTEYKSICLFTIPLVIPGLSDARKENVTKTKIFAQDGSVVAWSTFSFVCPAELIAPRISVPILGSDAKRPYVRSAYS